MENINDLFSKKQKIEKQIIDLQKKCKHTKKIIKSVRENEAGSNFVIRWVCEDCESIIRYPTQQEISKYLNNG